MGYYIQTPMIVGKAEYLKKEYQAEEIEQPTTLIELSIGKALVCVIENPLFDAAGYVYSDSELQRALPTLTDKRKRTWLIMDEQLVKNLSGFY